MGLRSFLSKKKKEKPEEILDLPPLPPGGEEDLGLTSIGEEIPPPPEFEEGLPPFPSPIEKEEVPMPEAEVPEELPPLPELPEEAGMPFEEEIPAPPGIGLPEEPTMPPFEEEIPALPPRFIPPRPRIIPTQVPPIPRPTKVVPERPAVRKAIFIRVDDFKTVLREISLVRGDLTGSEDALVKLANLEVEKNKRYGEWHENIKLIQKKLTSVDKVLSKGD